MAGALIQLVAYGAQDIYLTSEPTITFWKSVYRRHTNFAIESIEQTLSNTNFGYRSTCKVSRNGDLISRTYLQTTISGVNESNYWKWAEQVSGGENFSGNIDVSSDGTFAIVVGNFSNTIYFTNTITLTSVSDSDVFVAKIDSNGNWLWARRAGITSTNAATNVKITSNNIIIIGIFTSTIQFGSLPILSNGQFQAKFMTIINFDGEWTWSTSIKGNAFIIQNGKNNITMNITSDSYVLLCGTFSQPITIGNLPELVNEGNIDMFVAKFNINTLTFEWQSRAGGIGGGITPRDISIDESYAMITGNFNNYIYFNDIEIYDDYTNNGQMFIATIDMNGNWLWATQVITTGDFCSGNSLSILNDSALITGSFSGSAIFGTIELDTGDIFLSNLFIGKITNGTWIWVKQPNIFDGSGSSSSITISSDNIALLTGSFTTQIQFDNLPILICNGNQNSFITKLDMNGNYLQSIVIPSDEGYISNLKIINNYAIITGYFIGSIEFNNEFNSINYNSYVAIMTNLIESTNTYERLGFQLLKEVELRIGGQTIDKQYSNWMYMWTELTHTVDKKSTLNKIVGASDGSSTLIIPLYFFFCRHTQLALPLISLQYHEVEIIFTFEQAYNCFTNYSTVSMNNTSVWIDTIFLDTEERKEFAQKPHEYLIEIVQSQEITLSHSLNTVKLDFNHPTKFIVWGVKTQSSAFTDFTDNNDSCVQTAQLKFNGIDRFSTRSFDYFNYIQPYQHFTGSPNTGICVYSFATNPEQREPSGSCNFSRIDNIDLIIKTTTNGQKLYLYSFSYNVLRVASGMAGLAFSN
jgi:hypothetical protein